MDMYEQTVNIRADKPTITRLTATRNGGCQRRNPTAIKKIVDMGVIEGYVYDLQTANHHFSAGVGDLVVHNTDSVFIDMGVKEVAEAIRLGKEAAELATKVIIRSHEIGEDGAMEELLTLSVDDVKAKDIKSKIKLEFEKILFPHLMMAKKRYAALYWEDADKPSKMLCKGLETVRRDTCKLLSETVQGSLDRLVGKVVFAEDGKTVVSWNKGDKENALAYARDVISQLRLQNVDLSKLVISKAYKGPLKVKAGHVELVEKMRLRDPASAPVIGDRVPYVIIGNDKQPHYERCEDPSYVLEHDIPVSSNWYISNQLTKPLTRIFEPILKERTQSLFVGDHTRAIKQVVSANVGLAGFMVRQRRCLGCSCPIDIKSTAALCTSCDSTKRNEIYVNQVSIRDAAFQKNKQYWDKCAECVRESGNDAEKCNTKDCDTLLQRAKSRKDLNEATKRLACFDVDIEF
jgi:DNA polymerase delta subunit 1